MLLNNKTALAVAARRVGGLCEISTMCASPVEVRCDRGLTAICWENCSPRLSNVSGVELRLCWDRVVIFLVCSARGVSPIALVNLMRVGEGVKDGLHGVDSDAEVLADDT